MPNAKSHMPDASSRSQLKLVIVGHVDHGKSTLVGRLLFDTDSLTDGKYEQIKASCDKRGMPFEWSFLMDALQTERDQGITIDTTQIWLKLPERDVVIIDAPGHKEFLKNMITGAAQSDAALLLIDAHEGIREQSKRHGYLLHLLGVKQIAVVVNKMDRVGYAETTFHAIQKEYEAYLKSLGVTATCFIPISAREGDCIANASQQMPWYKGPSVLEALSRFETAKPAVDQPLRFPVQDVYKFDDRRIIAGRIESGSLKVGDELMFSPSNARARVSSIEEWNSKIQPQEAYAGQSVGITLDDQIFVERGHVISHQENAPMLTSMFRARIFWLGHQSLTVGKRYKLKLATAELAAEVRSIEKVIDAEALGEEKAESVGRNQVAEITFRVRGMAAVDDYLKNPKGGRFVIVEGYDAVGGGIIDVAGLTDQRIGQQESRATHITPFSQEITPESRAIANGHFGGILWFSGLSGAGKSTIAQALQQRLFAKGYQVFVLDGDNVRKGLNRDLGFSLAERHENIRRASEVAALFAEAGMIVITSFISPTREDRRIARNAAPQHMHSVYIKADLETCEGRDVKGLYKKARAGEIAEFTGISSPFEPPENPDIVVDTEAQTVEQCVQKLAAYVEKQFVEPARALTVGDFAGTGI